MTRLKSPLPLARTIIALLVITRAPAGVLSGAGRQMKRARTPKSADATPAEQEEARAASHAQIIRENNFGVALMNRQQFEQALGNSDAAIEDFKKVAQLDPYDADTQYFLGLVFSQEHEYDKAIAAFTHAIELNPFQVSAEFGLAQALQRKDDTARAKEHFDRFQHLVSEKLGKPVSFIYGEQGKYSLAESMMPPPEPVPPAVPVHFVNVTSLSGLLVRAEATQAEQSTPSNATKRHGKVVREEVAPESVASFLGSGACIIDYDGDGRPDIFLVDADGQGNAALYKNEGGGRFVNVTRQAKLEIHGEGMGCAVGDYDNDGKPDLAVTMNGRVLLFHNEGKGIFKDVTEQVGIEMDGLAMGVTFIDYDHDGDLDLYVTRFNDFPLANPAEPFSFPVDATAAGNVLWRNNGNGTFTDWTAETGLSGSAPSVGAIGSDLNNDRAIDFVVTGWQKAPVAFMNPREGIFQATTPWATDMPAPTAGVTALDFDKDGWMDLAFTHWGTPGLSLWRNVQGKSFERVLLPDLEWMRGWGVAALDYDNDGWMDLVAVGENFSGDGRIVLLRNEGEKGFRDVTSEVGLDKTVLHYPRGVIAD